MLPSRLTIWFQRHIRPKLKFAVSSTVATLIDYLLYIFLSAYIFTPVTSNVISMFTGMIVNFVLQKKYIFVLRRKVNFAFALSIGFSLLGIALGTTMIGILVRFKFFMENQYITKLLVTGIVFFYSFYTKRFAFEKKFIGDRKI